MKRRKLHAEQIAPVPENILMLSGVPRLYWRSQLSAIEGEPEYKLLLGRYMDRIHEHDEEGKGLLLYGGFNTGKTSLAVIVLKEVIQRGGIAHFISSKNIPSAYFGDATLDDVYDEPVVIKDRIRRSNLVVIDDLGAECFDTRGHGGSQIEGVLRDAYEEVQMVIMTTNMEDLSELEVKFTKGVVSLLGRITKSIKVVSDQWDPFQE